MYITYEIFRIKLNYYFLEKYLMNTHDQREIRIDLPDIIRQLLISINLNAKFRPFDDTFGLGLKRIDILY